MTRVGVPALAGAVLALVLALISGLGAIAGATVGMGAGLAPEYEAGKEIGTDAGFLGQGDAATSNRGDGASSEVRYGNLSLEVDDVDDALARVTAIAEAAGGYISSSSRSGEGENLYLSLTLRLPAAQFTDVMASLRDEGDVVYEDFGSYDVTMQVLDLEARLENLRASERAFLDLLDRSQTVADIVAVQTELSRIQGDIESYEAQLGAVKDQVEMANINVSHAARLSGRPGVGRLRSRIRDQQRACKSDQRRSSGRRRRDQHRGDRRADRNRRCPLRFGDRSYRQRDRRLGTALTRRCVEERAPRCTALIDSD
jgi:hypothetical protein